MPSDRSTETCYACSRTATTREHVPPLCLFPETKDLGINLRQNLITVPSCDLHNSKKSDDDEFLMITLAGIVGNNVIGYVHTKTKIHRALKRKSKQFLSRIIRNGVSRLIQVKEQQFPIIVGTPDVPRLIKCFESIALGLYRNDFGRRFIGQVKVMLGFINYNDESTNKLINFLRNRFEFEDLRLEVKGRNSKVFEYQFCQPDQFGLISLKIIFYQGADVFITFIPDGVEKPSHLGIEMINNGMPVTIDLQGEKYHFNQKK